MLLLLLQKWESEDLMAASTNYAMVSDILRMEIGELACTKGVML